MSRAIASTPRPPLAGGGLGCFVTRFQDNQQTKVPRKTQTVLAAALVCAATTTAPAQIAPPAFFTRTWRPCEIELEGYHVLQGTMNDYNVMVRGIAVKGDFTGAVDVVKKMRVYPWSERSSPKPAKFVSFSGKVVNTLPPSGIECWTPASRTRAATSRRRSTPTTWAC